MPKEIQDAVGSVALQTEYGLVGGFRLKLDETVVPVVIMKDLSKASGSAWRDAFIGDIRGVAGAGNRNIWQLENPDNSGKLVHLYKLTFASDAFSTWEATVTNVNYVPGTILSPQWQDLDGIYVVPNTFPVANPRFAAANAAITGQNVFCMYTPAQRNFIWTPDVYLHPGQEITLWMITTNTAGYISMEWRERPLRQGER